ncbi:putative septum site-determining protein MinC [Gammaproteobacteria bacterium]
MADLPFLAPILETRRRPSAEQAPVIFKGSSFTLTIAHVTTGDLDRITRELTDKIAQAPAFFQDIPLVLDFQSLESSSVDLDALVKVFRTQRMNPLGVRNATPEQQATARALGLSFFATSRREEARPTPPVVEPRVKPRVSTQPIRSGQQVYAPGGDLVLLGMVNSGAEALADGCIHSYAPLRGRALAGIKGDKEAHIFTYCLEAELLSIAGSYRVIENILDLPIEVRGKPAHIYLSSDRIMIDPIHLF